MKSRLTAVLATTFVCLLAVASSAQAAFPGANGKVAFDAFFAPYVHLVNPDGTGAAYCCTGRYPAWSPDGQRLAYENQFGDLVTSKPDGTDEQIVLENFGGNDFGGISWSPDGGKLIFDLANCLEGCAGTFIDGIYVINIDGTNFHCVICDPASGNGDPAWSPDGNRFAFVSNRDVAFENQIYVSDLSGAVQTRLTNSPGSNLFPNWSPSGQRIAFASNRDGNYEIYSMRSDGTDVKRLTQDPDYDSYPAWSPDAAKIAFVHGQDLYVMNADGTGITPVTTDASYPDWQPILGPQRSDYKSAEEFCRAERDFLGAAAFRHKYGGPKNTRRPKNNGSNAFGRCVSRNH